MDKDSRARFRNSPSLKRGDFSEAGLDLSCFAQSPPRTEALLQLSDQLPQQLPTWREDEEGQEGEVPAKGFGEKTISFWGSCILNFNNITGPTMVVLPLLFQQAGWLFPTVSLLLMWVASSLAASMLCESMQRIPGNRSFGRRYEYCTLVRHYFGQKWYTVAMVAYNVGLVASNIAAMIVSSQVVDSILSRIFGATFGLEYSSWPPSLKTQAGFDHVCQWGESKDGRCSSSVITLGYLLAAGVCIPMGFLSLQDNMWLQWCSVAGQLLFSLCFVAIYIHSLLPRSPTFCPGNGPSRTSAIGSDISQVVGISVFSYAYVSTIPSWVNEKQPGVSVNRVVWLPSLAAISLNIMLAFLGSWTFNLLDKAGHPLEGTENILNVLVARAARETSCHFGEVPFAVEVSAYLWGLLGYLPGIPVLSIMVRYNLMNGGFLSPPTAFFSGVVLPWLITAFFYQAEMLLQFCNWMAILFQGFINFVVPAILYRAAILTSEDHATEPVKLTLLEEDNKLLSVRAMGPRQSNRTLSPKRQVAKNGSEEKKENESLLNAAATIFEETRAPKVDTGLTLKLGRETTVNDPVQKLEKFRYRSQPNGSDFTQVVERRMAGEPGVSIELLQFVEEDNEDEKSRSSFNSPSQTYVFSRTADESIPENEREVEEVVSALPKWFPVSPSIFSSWMAISLGALVCAIIVDSFVQAVRSWF